MTTRPTTALRSLGWIAFFVVILIAWLALFWSARASGVDALGRIIGPNRMPMDSAATLFPMWAIMMAAMMLPTLLPTIRAYRDLMASANGTAAGLVGLVGGYLAVWIGFGAVLTLAQVFLMQLGVLSDLGAARSGWIAAVLLAAAGLFQFSRTKEICHGVCLAPMMYFLGRWRPGGPGGLRMGAGLGAFCVGCCWAIMALGFVGGVMSLAWMGLATLFMVLEKLPQIGQHLTRPAGLALIGAAIVTAGWTALS